MKPRGGGNESASGNGPCRLEMLTEMGLPERKELDVEPSWTVQEGAGKGIRGKHEVFDGSGLGPRAPRVLSLP